MTVETLERVRALLDFLPLNNREKPPVRPIHDDPSRLEIRLDTLVPDITGFLRIEGRTVGVIANQPMVLAGCLDIDSSRKTA